MYVMIIDKANFLKKYFNVHFKALVIFKHGLS